MTHIAGSGQANKPEILKVQRPNDFRQSVHRPLPGRGGTTSVFRRPRYPGASSLTTSVESSVGGFATASPGARLSTALKSKTRTATACSIFGSRRRLPSSIPTARHCPISRPWGRRRTTRTSSSRSRTCPRPHSCNYGAVSRPAHSHLPTPEALKLVGDAFLNAPVSNGDGVSGHQRAFRPGLRTTTIPMGWPRLT